MKVKKYEKISVKFETNIKILEMYYDEWKYRLSQMWALVIKSSTFCIALIFMPYIYPMLKIDINIFPLGIWVFPAAGLGIASVVCFISTIEIRKINQIKTAIKKIVKNNFPYFASAATKRNSLHQNIPIMIFGIEIIFGALMLYFSITYGH